LTGQLGRRRWCMATALASAEVLWPTMTWARSSRTRLFTIERSKNKNVVCYDWIQKQTVDEAMREGPGHLDVYWRMHAERGQRQELNGLERELAYGYRIVDSDPSHEVIVTLKAAPRRTIAIDLSARVPHARTTIGSSQATLESIYVSTREGSLLPSVLFVELKGRLPGGTPVVERIRG
jgi:hypothetical protein